MQYNLCSYGGYLKRVVGATVVKVMAHTGDKESKNFYVSKKNRDRTVNNVDLLVHNNCFIIKEKYPFSRKADIYILEVAWEPKIFVEQVTKMSDRKGVHPVVVRRVPVAFLHHKTEPDNKNCSATTYSPAFKHGMHIEEATHCIYKLLSICQISVSKCILLPLFQHYYSYKCHRVLFFYTENITYKC